MSCSVLLGLSSVLPLTLNSELVHGPSDPRSTPCPSSADGLPQGPVSPGFLVVLLHGKHWRKVRGARVCPSILSGNNYSPTLAPAPSGHKLPRF